MKRKQWEKSIEGHVFCMHYVQGNVKQKPAWNSGHVLLCSTFFAQVWALIDRWIMGSFKYVNEKWPFCLTWGTRTRTINRQEKHEQSREHPQAARILDDINAQTNETQPTANITETINNPLNIVVVFIKGGLKPSYDFWWGGVFWLVFVWPSELKD